MDTCNCANLNVNTGTIGSSAKLGNLIVERRGEMRFL